MKKLAAIIVVALVVFAALFAQEADALRWPKQKPSAAVPPPPWPQPLTEEEKANCKSAHEYSAVEKPCLDEIVSNLHNGKNLTQALTGTACCTFYWGVESTCYVHAPTFLHPQLLEKHCPKP